jgi:hypothetical protein
MKQIKKFKESKSILEVRAIKGRLFKEYEKLGWVGFHKKCQEVGGELMASIEKARQEKLTVKQ